jgi:hypothetical protein
MLHQPTFVLQRCRQLAVFNIYDIMGPLNNNLDLSVLSATIRMCLNFGTLQFLGLGFDPVDKDSAIVGADGDDHAEEILQTRTKT